MDNHEPGEEGARAPPGALGSLQKSIQRDHHLPDLEMTHQYIKNPIPPTNTTPITEAEYYKYATRLVDQGSTQIRILELLPGSGHDALSCHIQTVGLNSANIEYETISYCWGEPILDAELIVEGEGKLPITMNLYNALMQFRHPKLSRLMWTDIVCVNQLDVEERTVQVQLMRNIYQKGQRVHIWLGDATKESDLAMDTIVAMHAALGKKDAAGDKRHLHDLHKSDRKRYGFFDEQSKEMKALLALYERPWFHRVWVVQELALSPTALLACGTKSVSWNDFVHVITSNSPSLKKFSTNENLGENHVRLSICPSWVEAHNSATPPLLTLVARTRNAQATDARDKVFGLSGLAQEHGRSGILGTPDYRIQVEDVYKQFVLENIKTYNNLDVLSLVHGGSDDSSRKKKLELPSWAPDLSIRGIPFPLTHLDKFALDNHSTLRTKNDYVRHCASKFTEASFTVRDDGNSLCLSGYVFSTIGPKLGLPFPGCTQWVNTWEKRQAQRNAWASWEAIVGTRTQRTYGNEKAYDVYWKTMRGGELEQHCEVAKKDFQSGYERPLTLYRLLSFGRVITSPTLFRVIYRTSCAMLDLYNSICHPLGMPIIDYERGIGTNPCEYRRMGLTSDGTVCLLPGATQPGDSLALLRGGRVPFVLRKCGENWKLVGECYVHGVMEGELWDISRCEDICLV